MVLLAVVNVGNSSYTLARYALEIPTSVQAGTPGRMTTLPTPEQVHRFPLTHLEKLVQTAQQWNRDEGGEFLWTWVGVQQDGLRELQAQLLSLISPERCFPLDHSAFQLTLHVRHPERVGVDRIAAAVAVNQLRLPDSAAIVIDCGTAVTVDLLTADGVFQGGTIFPGRQLALDALARGTSLLPQLTISDEIEPIGRDTESAMQAGVLFASTGAIDMIIRQFRPLANSPCQIFATGGGWPVLAPYIELPVLHVPYLVSNGVAWAWYHSTSP